MKKDNLQFYNLSKGAKDYNFKEFDTFNIIDLGNKNLFELAEIIKKFDVLISIDSALIHLAGVLNLDVYLLLNYNSDWRWFEDNKKTVWYPSVNIIKQNQFNKWDNVIENIEKIINIKYKKKFNE